MIEMPLTVITMDVRLKVIHGMRLCTDAHISLIELIMPHMGKGRGGSAPDIVHLQGEDPAEMFHLNINC